LNTTSSTPEARRPWFDACAVGQIDEIAVQQSADDDDQREDAGASTRFMVQSIPFDNDTCHAGSIRLKSFPVIDVAALLDMRLS
jgi:hypothetical protein